MKKKITKKKLPIYAYGDIVDSMFNTIDPNPIVPPRKESLENSMEAYKLLRAYIKPGFGVNTGFVPDLRTPEQQQENYLDLRASIKPGYKVKTGYTADKRNPEQAALDYQNQRTKYAFGNIVSPSTDLYENQIALAKASQKAENDPWAKGFQIFGNLAQQVGSTMMNSKNAGSTTLSGDAPATTGMGGNLNSFMNNNQGSVQSGMNMMGAFSQFMAMGGEVGNIPVEVEGQEVGQTPQGDLLQFNGPSHENGGIPINLPEGTEMYSKRIKVDGVSMADRKKKREKKTMTLEDLLEKNSTDALVKNSLNRTKQTNEIEETADNKIQEVVKQLLDGQATEKFANGGPIGPSRFPKPDPSIDYEYPSILNSFSQNTPYVPANQLITPSTQFKESTLTLDQLAQANPGTQTTGTSIDNIFGGLTFGDAVGFAGNMVSTFDPMKNTKANRAGDTPNINAFENYGKEGLSTLDKTKQYIDQIREQKLKDIELARTSSIKRNRNSARSINTSRALDLATDAQINNAQEETYNSFAQSMMGILSQQAGMETNIDSVVMQGEQSKDLADRQDRDNYFSQLAKDISTKGYGLQETGKDINQLKENKVTMNLINQLSAYGITVDDKGNLSSKNKKK